MEGIKMGVKQMTMNGQKKRKMAPAYIAARLAGTAGIELVVTHTAWQYWNVV